MERTRDFLNKSYFIIGSERRNEKSKRISSLSVREGVSDYFWHNTECVFDTLIYNEQEGRAVERLSVEWSLLYDLEKQMKTNYSGQINLKLINNSSR